MEKAIIVENVTKKYRLYTTAKERLFDLLTPRSYGEDFYALKNINFTAYEGEVVGFVGINGSGKSTLSNIIAGIVPQTSGEVTVNGEASLIAVAAGLKTELTGRDNIEMKLLMLGFSKKEIKALEPNIIEFSELGDFIDQPVKSYSSGMRSRLGFSISVNVNPDILIIDEALSVGDKAFAEKSLSKMNEFKEEGKTMIFVSHSLGQMKRFCSKILWLEFGQVKKYGDTEKVLPLYQNFLSNWERMSKEERTAYKNTALHKENNLQSSFNDDYVASNYNEEIELVVEKPISKLAHLKGTESYFLSYPNEIKKRSTEKFKNAVYYVKKEARYKNQTYCLLSTERSSKKGVIGWVNSKDLVTRTHVFIDNDMKEKTLSGRGNAYSDPWGGEKQLVVNGLDRYKDEVIQISRTEYVGKILWYKALIDGRQVWINDRCLRAQ